MCCSCVRSSDLAMSAMLRRGGRGQSGAVCEGRRPKRVIDEQEARNTVSPHGSRFTDGRPDIGDCHDNQLL